MGSSICIKRSNSNVNCSDSSVSERKVVNVIPFKDSINCFHCVLHKLNSNCLFSLRRVCKRWKEMTDKFIKQVADEMHISYQNEHKLFERGDYYMVNRIYISSGPVVPSIDKWVPELTTMFGSCADIIHEKLVRDGSSVYLPRTPILNIAITHNFIIQPTVNGKWETCSSAQLKNVVDQIVTSHKFILNPILRLLFFLVEKANFPFYHTYEYSCDNSIVLFEQDKIYFKIDSSRWFVVYFTRYATVD